MFEQVLDVVKQQLGQDPNVAAQIPPEKREAVHKEVAESITDGIQSQAAGGPAGMLSSLTGVGGGSESMVSLVTKTVSERLTGKFGLSAGAVQSISSAVPGIVQKFIK